MGSRSLWGKGKLGPIGSYLADLGLTDHRRRAVVVEPEADEFFDE